MAFGSPVYAPGVPGTPFGPASPFGNSPFGFPSSGLPAIGSPISPSVPWGTLPATPTPSWSLGGAIHDFVQDPVGAASGYIWDRLFPSGLSQTSPNGLAGLAGPSGTPVTLPGGKPPAGPVGPTTGKTTVKPPKITTKTKNKQPTFLDYLNSLKPPPLQAPSLSPPGEFPKRVPLTTKAIEGYIDKAERAGDTLIANATRYYNEVRYKVEHSPDMTNQAKKTAKEWIDSEIRVINRMQADERAAGKRNAGEILAATGAAAKLQQSFGQGMGQNYTNAASVLNALGSGVGAGVTGAGNQALGNIARVAPGQMPASVTGLPAQAGGAVTTLGGAVPAQNLALQAAGAGPGFVTGGAQNIANQMAAGIQGAGGNLAIGANRAGEQAASALNAKIFEAQSQFGPLFHQIYGDLTSHQDALNSQLLSMAQGGLTNAFTSANRLSTSAEKFGERYARDTAQINEWNLAGYKATADAYTADVAHTDQVNARNDARYQAAINRAFTYQMHLETIDAANKRAELTSGASGGQKPLTRQAFLKERKEFLNASNLLSGTGSVYKSGNTLGNYGDPVTINGKLVRPLESAPKTIGQAYADMYSRWGDVFIGPPGSKGYISFMNALRVKYGVPNWTDEMIQHGVGPIPGTKWVGPLPLNPSFTQDHQVRTSVTVGKEEDHDKTNFAHKSWTKYFEEHKEDMGYMLTGGAEKTSGGGGKIPGWMSKGALDLLGLGGLGGASVLDLIGGDNWTPPNYKPDPNAVGTGKSAMPAVGNVIGTPYSGTHAKSFNVQGGSDNWESENAVDIGLPYGSPIRAVTSGTIGSQFGALGGGRFAGLRLHLLGGGNEYYYGHLSKYAPGIGPGARVQAGQIIGYSGAANGVNHLHFASQSGNPLSFYGGD